MIELGAHVVERDASFRTISVLMVMPSTWSSCCEDRHPRLPRGDRRVAHTCREDEGVPGAGDRAALRPRATRAGAAQSRTKTKMATLGSPKTLDRFDWNHPRSIDRELFPNNSTPPARLHPSRRRRRPAARAGGLGKTTLAQNLGLRPSTGVHRPLLHAPCRPRGSPAPGVNPTTERRLRRYTAPDLLCLDELGYVPANSRRQISSFTSSAGDTKPAPSSSPPTSRTSSRAQCFTTMPPRPRRPGRPLRTALPVIDIDAESGAARRPRSGEEPQTPALDQ